MKTERKMRRNISLFITVLVVLTFLLGCAQLAPTVVPTKPAAPAATAAAPVATVAAASAGATQPPVAAPTIAPVAKIKRGGTLRFGTRMEIAPNMDPVQNTGLSEVLANSYDLLSWSVRNEKTGNWEDKPGLAESWEMTNNRTFVLKLRKGVKFQDGSPFNAEVAKWNLDRMKNYAKSAAKDDVGAISSVDQVDENTIRINLKGAPAGLLGILATSGRGWMASKTAVDKNGDEYLTRASAGSGPFQFVEWKTGDSMTYKKWDSYWDKGGDGQPLPYLDGIKVNFRLDKTVKALDLRSGNLDFIDEVDVKDIPALKSDPNLEFVDYPWSAQVQFFMLNMKKAPTDNLKIRQATLYSLDRENIAKVIGKGLGGPAYYFWGPGTLGYDETLPRYDFQPQKAKQLLTEAGFPNGIDIKLTVNAREPEQSLSQVMKQMWDQAGIRTTIEQLERTALVSYMQTGSHQIALSGRGWGVIDPELFARRFVTDGDFNFAHLSDPEVNKCFQEGRDESDNAKRTEIYKRCQRIIHELAPYGMTSYGPKTVVFSKKVKGWRPNYGESATVRDAWIE
jgi:peptide/nickel transport system substrate-binding protein